MDNVATPPPSRSGLGFMVPSPKDPQSLDPYAFSADEPVPRSMRASKPLSMSVHPSTFLPPGNPLPHADAHYQRGVEFFQQQFSAALRSPVHGSQPAQSEEQFSHPSSRLHSEALCQQMEQMQAVDHALYQTQPLAPAVVSTNSVLVTTAVTPEKAKKKKQKGGGEQKTAVQPSEVDLYCASLMMKSVDSRQSVQAASVQCAGDYRTQDMLAETRGVNAKSPASTLSVGSGDSSSSLPSMQTAVGQGTPCYPSSITAASFTNSLHTIPHNRRLSTDSLELPTSSRPASRTSTVSSSSGSSEGKAKEAADPVPMAKIMEIIEREKLLGSSSPCKRRRTAKPQHIQVAEEEAKKFAAANATQGVMKDAGSVESFHTNQHSSKKGLLTDNTSRARNMQASSLPEKSDSNSRTSSQMSSPGLPGLDTCISPHSNSSSNDRSEKTQPHLPVNDTKADDNLLSDCNKTVVYSASSGSYVDGSTKHSAMHVVCDGISTTFPQTFGSSVFPSTTDAGLGAGGGIFSAHTSSCITDTAGKQLTASAAMETPYLHHDCEALTPQNTIDNAKLHQSSNMLTPSISHVSNTTNCNTYLSEGKENTQSFQLESSNDQSYVDGTLGQGTLVSSAPKHVQHLNVMTEGKRSIQHSPSSFSPSSTAESRHPQLVLQNRAQSVFHPSSSSSPCPEWLSGSSGNPLASSGSQLLSPNTMVVDKDQDLKPTLTSNYHCSDTGSGIYRTPVQTADIISGNDCSPSQQQPPPLPTMPVSAAAKKPKKKRSTSKASLQSFCDNSVSVDTLSPSSVSFSSHKTVKRYSAIKQQSSSQPPPFAAFSGDDTGAGTLPPFGAFAGMKMDGTHLPVSYISQGSQSQPVTSVSLQTVVQSAVCRNALPPHQMMLTGDVYSDNSFTEDKRPRDVLRSGEIRSMANTMNDLSEFGSAYQNIEQEVTLNSGCDFSTNSSVSSAVSMPGQPVQLSTEQMEAFTPAMKQQYQQASSSEVLQHRTTLDSPLMKFNQDNMQAASPTGDRNNTEPSLCTPVLPCNRSLQKQKVDSGTMRSEKMNSRNLEVATTLIHNHCATQLTSVQGNVAEHCPAPACTNHFSPAQRMPSFHSKMPASGMQRAEVGGGPFCTSFENGKWSPQEKTSVRKIRPQEKPPAAMNGWNGKSRLDSCVWKRENGTYSRLPEAEKGSGSMMNNQFETNPVENVSRKTKARNRVAMKKTVSSAAKKMFPKSTSASVRPPSTSQPNLEPRFTPMTPQEELDDRLRNNRVEEVPTCCCLGSKCEFNESTEGPYYTQLGIAKDMPSLRRIMEERTGLCGNAIRLEKVYYSGKEGRTAEGCPIAKWIIRRSGPEEKYLCVARKRPGHSCDAALIVMVIVAWEGVDSSQADNLYTYLVSTLTKFGLETERRCGTNESKTCACQGVDLIRQGASFSFGCSWSMYFNSCKFARSNVIRKFKLKDTNEEKEIEEHLQNLATKVAPLYKELAPQAYHNQVHFEDTGSMCRLGKERGRPFSGVTACMDFCAHSHKDNHNMQNGSTVVVTLTKHRGLSKPDDEQLHVLPLYVMDNTDEHGSFDGQSRMVQAGGLEILEKYSSQARIRAMPIRKPRRCSKKNGPAKTATKGVSATVPPAMALGPAIPSMDSNSSLLHSQDSNQSLTDSSCLSGKTSTSEKKDNSSPSLYVDQEQCVGAEDAVSQRYGLQEMYEVWEYFYTHGVFPPPSNMEHWAAAQRQAMLKGSSANQGSSPQLPPSPQPQQAADPTLSSPSSQHSFPLACSPFSQGGEVVGTIDQEMAYPTCPDEVKASRGPLPARPCSVTEASSEWVPEGVRAGTMSLPSSPHPQITSTPLRPGSLPPSRLSVPPSSSKESPGVPCPHSNPAHSPFSPRPDCDGSALFSDSGSSRGVVGQEGSFVTPTLGQGPDEPTYTMLDPTVVRCQWQDNKENFHDKAIGGVAIALSHGAVLFEVAKRELHATTALKNPNRYQPTRISLVFYQHKNLNYYHHGYYEYERQLAAKRQDRIRKLMEEGQTAEEAQKAVKPGRKRKNKTAEEAAGTEEEEKVDFAKTSAAQYRYMWDTTVRHGVSLTTDSIITRWIDPQPMVTGPYQMWV